MEPRVPRPDTIQALRWGADAAFALLAGLPLDVFTPLQGGPLTPAQLAEAIGVGSARLRLLLYALVAAGLLTEQDGRFANTRSRTWLLRIIEFISIKSLAAKGEDEPEIMQGTADVPHPIAAAQLI